MKTFAARHGLLAFGLVAGLAAAPALAADKDPVVATFNGSSIHLSEVKEYQRELGPQAAQAPFGMVLTRMVENRLVSEAAEKDGMAKDPEVKREVKMAEEAAMSRAWIGKKVRAAANDDALKALYEKDIANFKPEDEVHARHILLETEDQAKQVIADLKSGANFEELAKSKSKDPSAQKNGGDLGFFTKGEMVPAFADAAFAMKPGEISAQPVKSQFGWHVIKVEERRQSTAPTLDDAKPMLREQMARQVVGQTVQELRDKAKVKLFNPDGSPLSEGAAAAGAQQ